MILLCLGIKQDLIIDKIESFEANGVKVFTLAKRDKSNLYFDTKLENLKDGCKIISTLVKEMKYGNAIFFNVFPVIDDKIQWF